MYIFVSSKPKGHYTDTV